MKGAGMNNGEVANNEEVAEWNHVECEGSLVKGKGLDAHRCCDMRRSTHAICRLLLFLLEILILAEPPAELVEA